MTIEPMSAMMAGFAPTILPPLPEREPGLYRYLVCTASTGAVLDELPLTTSGLPREIGKDTTTTFSLPLNDPRTGREWPGLVDPRRVPLVVVLRNDVPAWAGIITTSRGMNALDLGAVSLEGWFARRYNEAATYTGVDQLDIARALIAIAAPLGIPFTIDQDDSGVERDKTYEADQVEDLYAELSELADIERGFEWTVDVDYDPMTNTVTPLLRFGYPQLGTRAVTPEWRFELGDSGAGGNLTEADAAIDCSAGKFATEVIATGQGEGESRLISTPARDTTRETSLGLRVQLQTSYSNVGRQSTLDSHAARDLELVRNGETILTATARADVDPIFGQYRIGDDVAVVVEDTPRFPRRASGAPGLDVVTRLLGWTLNPQADTVDLVLDGGVAL